MNAQEQLAEEVTLMTRRVTAVDGEDERERVADEELQRLRGVPADSTSFVNSSSFVLPQWPELACEALHGTVGEFVRVVSPHSEADPAALLVQFLVWFGNIVGPCPHFLVEGTQHGCNLFAVLVGETGRSRKGTSEGQVRRIFDQVEPDWAGERVVTGLSSGEGLIYHLRNPVENNGGVTDKGVTDKRLLVRESEFASTLQNMGRSGNSLSPVLRNAWDRQPLGTLTRNNPLKATGTHVSVVGHITRNELIRLLTATDAANGFGNRFLWLCVKRSKCLPEGGNLREADLEEQRAAVARALEFGRQTNAMQRDPEAREVWAQIYPNLTEGRSGLLGSMTARSEAQVTRLSLVYALLDCSSIVRREHLEAALALWDYCESSAEYIFGDRLGDPVADDILRALRASGTDGMTRTQISGLFGRNKKALELGRALASLEENGLATPDKLPAESGRAPEVWRATSTKKHEFTKKGVSP